MASKPMTSCDDTQRFYDYLDKTSHAPVFTAETSDKKLVAFYAHVNIETIETDFLGYSHNDDIIKQFKSIPNIIYRSWRCNECRSRAKKYRNIICSQGPVLCQASDHYDRNCESVGKRVSNMWDLIRKSNSMKYVKLIPLVKDMVDSPFEGSLDGEEFKHFYLDFDHFTDDSVDIEMYKKALHRYSNLISTLLNKIDPSLVETLNIFKEIIMNDTYAKVLLPGTNWLIKICEKIPKNFRHMNILEKIAFIGKVICFSRISEDDNNDVVITNYHQVNNSILMLLEHGTRYGVDAMRKKISEDFGNPLTYQRRTKEATAKMAEIAMSKLKDFTNTIHTTAEIESHPDTVTVKGPVEAEKPQSSMSAFKEMAKPKKSSKYAFAEKHDVGVVRKPKTVTELMDMIRTGYITNLKIKSDVGQPFYTASTDIDRSNIIYDHLWLFTGSSSGMYCGKTLEITHIKNVKTHNHNNIMFVVKHSYKYLDASPITSNCCLPEFLSTKCKRTAGVAYEALNSRLPINIPKDQQLSLGFGVSVANSYGDLTEPINVYINGHYEYITISKY